ncbi:hypothetical protein [Nocardia vulneris]|uniref:hypothetical protein n=1 Tax=Nocardia vulneris TaxID=1141657 RepID=UPI000690AB00|nr:hypothetical protein [Nocardia vulneris]
MGKTIARNLKAVEAGIGGLLMLATLLLSLDGVLPAAWAGGIGTVVAVLTTFRVWLARNEQLIEQSADAIEDLVDETVGAFQIRG